MEYALRLMTEIPIVEEALQVRRTNPFARTGSKAIVLMETIASFVTPKNVCIGKRATVRLAKNVYFCTEKYQAKPTPLKIDKTPQQREESGRKMQPSEKPPKNGRKLTLLLH